MAAESPARVTAGDHRFPPAARLKKRSDFLRVQGRGRRYHGRTMVLIASRAEMPERPTARLGLTVSKKVGGAVVRNQVKRWLRECYRTGMRRLPDGMDAVIIARPSAPVAGRAAICQDLQRLLEQVAAPAVGRAARPRTQP